MAIQFTNKGFLNFNKKYNKVFHSGAFTASMTTTQKVKEQYETKYFNILVRKELRETFKKAIKDNQLVEVEGFATPADKGYVNFVINTITPVDKSNEQDEDNLDDLPF